MALDDTTTRPAGTGGIDLSGIDIAMAIFKALGGGYGGGSTGTTLGGDPIKTADWLTNFGDGGLVDSFDFSTPPTEDPNAPIKLVSETEETNPMFTLYGTDEPHFANGGPEGTGFIVVLAGVAVVAAIAVAADHLSDGAICDALGWQHGDKPEKEPAPKEGEKDPESGLQVWENEYRDPDTMTDSLQSPGQMFASLLGQAGIPGVDPTSPGVTDLLGKLSDNMGKVTELMGKLTGSLQAGDGGAVNDIMAELMNLAGLDPAIFSPSTASPDTMADTLFEAFGIAGGLDGAWFDAMAKGETVVEISDAPAAHWVISWDDLIA